MGWYSELGFWYWILVWDPGMGFWYGILGWDFGMEFWDGISHMLKSHTIPWDRMEIFHPIPNRPIPRRRLLTLGLPSR